MARLQSIQSAEKHFPVYKKIGHNTVATYKDGSFSLRYHRTNVVQYNDTLGEVIIDTGGWFTSTTSQRIHHGLYELGLMLLTTDLPYRWRVADHKGNAWTIRGNSLVLKRTESSWQRVQQG